MAEPLTSSDIIRMERGFGVSPLASAEERQRFSAAGQLPVSSTQAQRILEGRGISPSASKEEKKAWVASEVMLGMRGPEDLPEEYGGRPQLTARPRFDRRGEPTGSFRRQLRMQESWDKQQEYLANQVQAQEAARKAARDQQEYDLKYAKDSYDFETKKNQDLFAAKVEADRSAAEAEFTDLINKLNPNDPTSVGVVSQYISSKPQLADSKVAYAGFDYFQKAAANSVASIQAKEKEAAGKSITEYLAAGGDPAVAIKARVLDPLTGEVTYNIDRFKLDEETARLKGAGVKAEKEKEAKQPQVEAEKAAASSARSLINDFEKESARSAADIARLTKLVQGGDKKSQALLDAKMAEKSVYDSKIEELRAGLGGGAAPSTTPTVPTIKSPEEFNNLPSGAEYIAPNGKKYRKN